MPRRLTAAAPARRKSARPRDASATKAIILDCATREFAEKGFDGARVDRIVGDAGVNVSLAYQYFGSKEGLFIAVMEASYRTIREEHHEIDVLDLEPREAMETLVRNTFRIFIRHPEFIGLLNSENVNRGRHIAQSEYIRTLYNPLLDTIASVLRRGIESGVFRVDADPQDLFVSLTGVGYFLLSNRYTLSVVLRRDVSTAAAFARHEEHIVAVILGYLRPPGEPPRHVARKSARKG